MTKLFEFPNPVNEVSARLVAAGLGAALAVAVLLPASAVRAGGAEFGSTGVAVVLVGMITVAASLEAVVGFCLGCKLFALLMKAGIVPEETCEACNNLALRRAISI